MIADRPRPSSAEVMLRGLDALDVVHAAGRDRAEAMVNAVSMLEGLDEETLRRVAAFLAGCTVRVMGAGRPLLAERELQRWRLEAMAQLPIDQSGGGS